MVGHCAPQRGPVRTPARHRTRVEDVPPSRPPSSSSSSSAPRYYQRPLGEVIAAALPPRLRQVSRRAHRPRRPGTAPAHARSPRARAHAGTATWPSRASTRPWDRFHPVLLHGVTGSGKTEVYLHAHRRRRSARGAPGALPRSRDRPHAAARGPGARTLSRVRAWSLAHSHLGEGERAAGMARGAIGRRRTIVLGTRLAVLMPFRDLGLIVVDEEHDASYKQQEGLRYSARDVAVRRAQSSASRSCWDRPRLRSRATPTRAMAATARDARLRAPTGAQLPRVRTVDTRADRPREGLTAALVRRIARASSAREQSLVVRQPPRLRSGALSAASCAWHSTLQALQREPGPAPARRASCAATTAATASACRTHARLAAASTSPRSAMARSASKNRCSAALPKARIARVDRDSTARKGALRGVLQTRARGRDRRARRHADARQGPRLSRTSRWWACSTATARSSAPTSAPPSGSSRSWCRSPDARGAATAPAKCSSRPISRGIRSTRRSQRRTTSASPSKRWTSGARRRFRPSRTSLLLRAESKRTGEAGRIPARRSALRAQRSGARRRVEVFDPVPALLERKAGFERAQLLVRSPSRAALQRIPAADGARHCGRSARNGASAGRWTWIRRRSSGRRAARPYNERFGFASRIPCPPPIRKRDLPACVQAAVAQGLPRRG